MKKYIAIFKYLFFPFLMAKGGDVDFTKLTCSHDSVITSVQMGNISWVGTHEGLWLINQKNGKVQHYTTQNSILPSNHITGICVTPNENIYVSTDKGIFRFDGFAFLLINTDNSQLPTNDITSIACDVDGNLHLGIKNGEVIMAHNYRCVVQLDMASNEMK